MIFISLSYRKNSSIHNSCEKRYTDFDKGKKLTELCFFNEKKGPKLDPDNVVRDIW